MTEHEAEALTIRQGRIWGPDNSLRPVSINSQWIIEGKVGEGAFLRLVCNDRSQEQFWTLLRIDDNGEPSPVFVCRGQSVTTLLNDDFSVEFAFQWIPFFRRGCWLSGCRIEATAHEKTEWMQGFSCEELEAWNLKM